MKVAILQKVEQDQKKEMLGYNHSRNHYWSHTSYSQIPQIIINSRETSYLTIGSRGEIAFIVNKRDRIKEIERR